MTKEMLNQLEGFEIFVEKMESFVNDVMSGERSTHFNRNDFDLRTFNGDTYPIPNGLQDYMNLWKAVQDDFAKVKKTWEDDDFSRNEFFFDLYWNDKQENAAYYDDEAFWLFYDCNKGVVYDIPTDKETLESNREWIKYGALPSF